MQLTLERVLYVKKEYPGDLAHGGIYATSLYLPTEGLDIRFLEASRGGDTVVKVSEEELSTPQIVSADMRLGEAPTIVSSEMLKERYDAIARQAHELYQAAETFSARRESMRPLFEELRESTREAIWTSEKQRKKRELR